MRRIVCARKREGRELALFERIIVGSDGSETAGEAVRQAVGELYRIHQPPIKYLPMRPGEIPGARVVAEFQTLHNIGINPDTLTPFGLGIEETVKWFAENRFPAYQARQVVDQANINDTVKITAAV